MKANIHDTLWLIDSHHQPVLIAANIEDHAILTHNARIAVHIFDVGRCTPGRPRGITIPREEVILMEPYQIFTTSRRLQLVNAETRAISLSE